MDEITKKWYKQLRVKYLLGEHGDWQGFFDDIIPSERHIVFDDIYSVRDQLENPLDYMMYLPDNMLENSTLPEIELPANITKLGKNCFKDSQLTLCKILGPVKELPTNCFRGCEQLQTLYLPETITSIEFGAFTDCNTQMRIFSKKTGRKIMVNKSDLDFLLSHFVED